MPAENLSNPVVAVVGATGAVGVELIRCPLNAVRIAEKLVSG